MGRREPSERTIIRILFVIGIVLFLSEAWKQWCITFRIGNGSYDVAFFPFQLCSIPMYLCLLLPFIKGDRFRKAVLAFLSCFSLLSGIMAFLDTSGFVQYGWLPLVIHSYAWHVLLIVIGILSGIQRVLYEGVDGFSGAVILYLACCLIAELLNFVLGRSGFINMFYINPEYDMSQIVFRDIGRTIGNPAVIIFYICMTITGAGMIQLIWRLIYRKTRG